MSLYAVIGISRYGRLHQKATFAKNALFLINHKGNKIKLVTEIYLSFDFWKIVYYSCDHQHCMHFNRSLDRFSPESPTIYSLTPQKN